MKIHSRNYHNDISTLSDYTLLMVYINDDKMHVLDIVDDDSRSDNPFSSNHIAVEPRLSTSHCHVPDDKFDYVARNRLIAVLLLCIVFMIIEIIGGILSNSTAIMIDAVHMGIDVASFLMSLLAMYLATKRPTQKLSFGYYRAEVLGALLSILMLWLGTGILVHMAIGRFTNQNFEVKPNEMITVASCGVVFNIIMFFVLHANIGHHSNSCHGHSHANSYKHLDDISCKQSHGDEALSVEIASGHNHRTTTTQAKASNNINVRAAIIHVIGDFVQSVGVLIAAILIKIKPEYKLADPICTFIFSVLVLITTITIMRDIVLVLMEGVPSSVEYSRVVDDLLRVSGVRNAHSLHIWSLSIQKTALSVHIAIDSGCNCSEVLNEAQEMLRREHSITESTIQVEIYDAVMMNSCQSCQRPNT